MVLPLGFFYFLNYTACAAGYYSIPGSGICEQCPTNTTSQPGASECHCSTNDCPTCPSNSIAQDGSNECTCVPDYYRTSVEGLSDPCTSENTMQCAIFSVVDGIFQGCDDYTGIILRILARI